jgi:GT2 family glycosyltransferase
MRKKVSAAIVIYNDLEKAVKAVESLVNNTKDVDLELFIIDNNSKDNGGDAISKRFPDINVIVKEKNKGFGDGHNSVLERLDSDYHAVINPDIVIDRDVLSELSNFLDNNGDVVLVTPKILNTDGTDQQLPKRDPTVLALVGRRIFRGLLKREVGHYQMKDKDLSKTVDIEFATGCFFMMRTSVFKKLGGFDTNFFLYYEDMDITRRARRLGRTVYYPETYVYHAWERSSMKKLKYFLLLVLGMFKYFNKWGWKWKYSRSEKNNGL